LGLTPEFPAATHRVEFPSGYTAVRFFALKHVKRDKSHYMPTPAQTGGLPAVSIREALRDLAPICRKNWTPKNGTPDRRITQKADYTGSPSAYGLAMRQWEGFTTDAEVTAHVVRHTPRDYPHFSAMRHGEQYPEMHRRAVRRFRQLVARRRRQGEALRTNSQAWREARDSIVPPYDPEKFPNKWRKLEPDRPSCTLTAHLGKDSYSHIHYESDEARTVSVREAARLQSFPDGFIFHGSMNSAFRQIGNAVPPLLAYAIALEIARALNAMNADRAVIAYREAAE
jgi:DNA (cytosine-5)-methyltransferase 1